jgi:hypothetical protein
MASDMRWKRNLAVAVAAVAFTLSSQALAEPTQQEKEQARTFMEDGDKKRDNGDLPGALEKYKAADAIMNVPTTALEVARAQASLFQLVEARDTLTRIAKTPPKKDEPPPFTQARKTAEQMAIEIGARIPTLQINVTGGDSPQVTIDGEAVPVAALAQPRKMNPGKHLILAHSGANEKKEEVNLSERETRTVSLDFGGGGGGSGDVVVNGSSGSALPKVLIFGGFGLAIVGVGVGTVTGLMSISKTNELKDQCPNGLCASDKQGDIDSAKGLGNISTIAFIAGGVGVAAGVVGLVLSGGSKKEEPPPAAARVRPVLGPGYGGLAGVF